MSDATPNPALPGTEAALPGLLRLDSWPDADILGALLDGQARALAAVRPAIPALARAARMASDRLSKGGRLIYLASGSPALIGLGDALEVLVQKVDMETRRIDFRPAEMPEKTSTRRRRR